MGEGARGCEMTEQISMDLADLHRHPAQAIIAAVLTLLLMLGCPLACVWSVVQLVLR